jgi:signal transduction histidine kinase
MGNKSFVWLTPFLSMIFIIGFAYALFKYRLLDIDVVIKRATLYIGFIGVITGIYALIIILSQRLISAGFGWSNNPFLIAVVAAIIMAFTLQPLRDWLDKITDKLFFQAKYNYFQLLESISRDLSTMVRLEDMLNMTASAILNAMHLDKLGIYILGRGVGQLEFQCAKKIGEKGEMLPSQLPEDTPVTQYLTTSKKLLVTGEFLHYYGHLYTQGRVLDPFKAEIQKILDQTLHAGVIVPLWLKGHLAGFLVLGDKKSGDSFTDRDLSFLETIANQMAVVLENTRLYEQMLNNERLTVLGAMSASIAHEIRNPLAAIKAFVQMLPNKYQLTDFRMRFDEIVPAELDRLTRITEDLLIFARPSSPAFVATDVNALITRVLTLMHNQIHKREIIVETQFGVIPPIQADGQQITQVIMNLLLNAIQSSKPKMKVYIQTRMNTSKPEPYLAHSFVWISIRDEGPGIPEKDFQNIFLPFFTTKHEGTGLGLPTSKRIVDAHHGDIFLESEMGKGTVFTIVLPLHQPSSETVEL